MSQEQLNLDQNELASFDAVSSSWWDTGGPFRPLHELNPTRLEFIRQNCSILDSAALDVGCGGGILAESLAADGARVTAIDVAPRVLDVARLHLVESGLEVDYQEATVEQFADDRPGHYDLVTCMEMLEHVPDPKSVVQAISELLKPGGHAFFSTLNRTPRAYLMAIVGAEHIARLLPRGTHRYDRFIRPSELSAWARTAGLNVHDIKGIHYDPLARFSRLGGSTKVNYIVHTSKSQGVSATTGSK